MQCNSNNIMQYNNNNNTNNNNNNNNITNNNNSNLQDRMLVACNVGVDTVVASAPNTWSSLNTLPCPSDTDARRQRSLDEPNVTRDVKAIWEGASSEVDKARLLASKAPHSSGVRYKSPLAAYAYPTKPSDSPSVCAWA